MGEPAGGCAATEHPLAEGAPPPRRVARATKDPSAIFTWTDGALTELLGWTADEMVGHRSLEFIHPDDHRPVIASWMQMLTAPASVRTERTRYRHKDGSWIWFEVTHRSRVDDLEHGDVLVEMVAVAGESSGPRPTDGDPVATATATAAAAVMAAHEALRAREQLLNQVTEAVPLGLFHVDAKGELLFANERLGEITGVAVLGSRLTDHLARVVAGDRAMVLRATVEALSGSSRDVTVSVEPTEGGGVRHCTLRMRPLLDAMGAVSGVTGCVEDITDSVRMREELEQRATRDPLTGCLNRAAVLALLAGVLRAAGAERRRATRAGTAAVFIDLDRFKPVNDRLGHAVGDELLARFADRLRGSVRADDAVGRIGGDEFLVVCPGVHSAAAARRLARAIASRAGGEVDLEGGRLEVSASVGVAWTDDPDADADRLVAEADAAMYVAKRSRGGVSIHHVVSSGGTGP